MSTADEAPGKRIRGQPESTRTREWKPGGEGARVLCRVFDIAGQVLKGAIRRWQKSVDLPRIGVVFNMNHPTQADNCSCGLLIGNEVYEVASSEPEIPLMR